MPIVYSGVQGSGHGDLFQGLKIWIAHRVPQRDRILDLVKNNGGNIVRLEKSADIMIADHLKAGGVTPPPGAYSWQWIDTSVKNGFLEDKDDYLIGRRNGTARDARSSEPTKVGRTAFTNGDDLVLTKWILAEERRPVPLTSKAMYQALEKTHPRHTWQSWRDRWVKTLSKRHPNIPEEELQVEVEAHNAELVEGDAEPPQSDRRARPGRTTRPSSGSSNLQPQVEQPPSVPSTPRARAPMPAATPSSSKGKGRMYFTKEEDQLLLACIEQKRAKNRQVNLDEDKDLSGNVIYKDFAIMHPSHTWHAWRDRWVRHLRLREAVDDAGPDEASNAGPEQTRVRASREHPNDVVEVPSTAPPGSSLQRNSAQQQKSSKPDKEKLKQQQDQERKARIAAQARAATLIGKTWRGHAVRRDQAGLEAAIVPLQSLMRGFMARMKAAERLAAIDYSNHEPAEAAPEQDDTVETQFQDALELLDDVEMDSEKDEDLEELSPQDQFWQDLHDITEVTGMEIVKEPVIAGRKIDLWQLYSNATQQRCEPEDRDWKAVAEGLGFEPVKSLVRKVQACYLQNLADFEDHIQAFESKDGENTEQGLEEAVEPSHDPDRVGSIQPTSEAVTAPKQPLAIPSSPAYRSSPPAAGVKRSFAQTDLIRSDPVLLSSGQRKRRRVDRSSVIPPTPEDKLGLSGQSYDRLVGHNQSSPLKEQTIANGKTVEISSDDESDELMDDDMNGLDDEGELPALNKLPAKKFIEPETQDWHIEQDHPELDNEDDVSPSQQLLLESDAIQSPNLAPRTQYATMKSSGRSPSPEPVVRVVTARVLRSNAHPATARAPVASSSRSSANGIAAKRTLPAQYGRKSAIASSSGSVLPRKGTPSQPAPQSSDTAVAHRPSTALVRAAGESGQRPQTPIARTTPKTVMQGSQGPVPSSSYPASKNGGSSAQGSQVFDEEYVVAQVRHFQALGYKEKHINIALEAASMQRGPMIMALEDLKQGRGLPQNVPGIWTEQDCRDLWQVKKFERQAAKGKGIEDPRQQREYGSVKVKAWHLKQKHTRKVMEERWVFMKMMGQTGEA